MDSQPAAELLGFIVDRVDVGIVAVNEEYEIVVWNKFMQMHSSMQAKEVLGRNLFDCFPELPENWLKKKIKSVFILRNFSFTSWKQRPYLFKFRPNRVITEDTDAMRQNCTFLPVKDQQGNVKHVCITLFDVTDSAVFETQLNEKQKELKRMSITDGLTGIYNRAHLEQVIAGEFNRVQRYGGDLSLILFDIDYFKKINDNFGHLAGDEVLRRISATSQSLLRQGDSIGRYGGEEFAVIVPGSNAQGAQVVAERIRKNVAKQPIATDSGNIPVTVSLGVAELVSARQTRYEDLIHEADTALYFSKQSGRNMVSCFDPEKNPA